MNPRFLHTNLRQNEQEKWDQFPNRTVNTTFLLLMLVFCIQSRLRVGTARKHFLFFLRLITALAKVRPVVADQTYLLPSL